MCNDAHESPPNYPGMSEVDIELDVEASWLHLDVSDNELARRRSLLKPAPLALGAGHQQMYVEHVMQADKGADLDFLVGCRVTENPRGSH